MCTAAEDMHILHIFTHVQYLDFKLLCYTQKYISKYYSANYNIERLQF